ncbi:PilT protein domain-containing protein [Halorhabdus tiamatea SARL4B]|uniref:PilT domain protein n=1 Tax=Halorhabdus tiamatea SARL4B TaxID=1033806 RepID=F7PNY5_9EURY|nr:PIN domain-containing protein [Halorhabdus tiamatea]ERJ05351.1 PilT protein domain-containing protein [Halorhabdus tiamatea SARL4B]CCQ33621.1 PilT domain protein [Halorhabdus tiamatea SARL4B]
MSVPDPVVFDAEPLVAHAEDEPGSDVVETYLDAVAVEDATGYVSRVNLTEFRYTIARKYDRPTADEYLDWLTELGVEPVDVAAVWTAAAECVLRHNPALGDAFALATAEHLDGTLLVGGDDDYDGVTDIPIERFRDGGV